ncbi:MAG: hypothetical protein NTV63_02475 [Candidatus Woesearchaeota archaeon]|nr:hypothetical protein [Candidatus Woesearchaeota archaeon]
MRKIIPIIAFALIFASIASLILAFGCSREAMENCPDERPLGCMDFRITVCGSDGMEYPNWCTACMNEQVSWFTKGSCKK